MSEPKPITVLIRTSNRPVDFKRALKSVLDQVYSDTRVIVSYDTETKPYYIPEGIQTVKVAPDKSAGCFYNLYCNDLKAAVSEGYFMFLDDDDTLNGNHALKYLEPYLAPDSLTMCRMLRCGKVKPKNKTISSGQACMPCIILHSKHKDLIDMGSTSDADYVYAKGLSERLPVIWAPIVVVKSDKRGNGLMSKT